MIVSHSQAFTLTKTLHSVLTSVKGIICTYTNHVQVSSATITVPCAHISVLTSPITTSRAKARDMARERPTFRPYIERRGGRGEGETKESEGKDGGRGWSIVSCCISKLFNSHHHKYCPDHHKFERMHPQLRGEDRGQREGGLTERGRKERGKGGGGKRGTAAERKEGERKRRRRRERERCGR